MDRYGLAAQGAENGLWDWDLRTSRLHYSPSWISMLGCSEDECGSTTEEWFKRIHPEDLETVEREIKSHLEKGSEQFEIQHRMLHKDGCYRWMSCQGVIVRDMSGIPVRITGFHADITADVVVDTLTGLPNRHLLLNRLARAIEKSIQREDFLYAVLLVDLDLFESGINNLETENGDALIVAAARRLESTLRTKDSFSSERRSDLVARSGSEEFTILLEGFGELGEAKKVAGQLLSSILAPFVLNGRDVSLSPSIGIALSATGYRNPEEALRDADAALYRAKSLGKSRCEVFDTAILESTQNRLQLEKELNGALSRNEFMVYYQPIVALSSNRVEGLEALLRWKHPSRGMIPPADFIPIAEKTGIILQLDRWVLREACLQLKEWQNNPHISKDLWISVNLSAAQFAQLSLAKEIRETLLETGLDANRLMLELTEGMAMEDPELSQSLLMQLRVMGTRIAIDDFGTGYSSLSYLRRFPLDYLKIDHSFVKSIENKADAREIIRAVHILARRLGLQVIVEGVENARQLNLIRSIGCEYGQGFLYSKPVGSEQVWPLLQDGFAFCEDGLPLKSRIEEEGAQNGLSSSISTEVPVADPGRGAGRKLFNKLRQKWVLAGLALLILSVMGILLVKLNRLTSPPIAHTSSLVPSLADEQQEKAVVPHDPASESVVAENPESIAAAPEKDKIKPPETLYQFRVKHDHRLGSCEGILKITRDSILFASEKEKDSFTFRHTQYSCSLDRDQLTIRSDLRVYRFKSATAKTNEENRSELSKIYKNLSRFHPLPISENR